MTKSRRLLELVAPPEEFTPEGHDATAEYDAPMDFYRSYSARTLYNTVWSTNNYVLPPPRAPGGHAHRVLVRRRGGARPAG